MLIGQEETYVVKMLEPDHQRRLLVFVTVTFRTNDGKQQLLHRLMTDLYRRQQIISISREWAHSVLWDKSKKRESERLSSPDNVSVFSRRYPPYEHLSSPGL